MIITLTQNEAQEALRQHFQDMVSARGEKVKSVYIHIGDGFKFVTVETEREAADEADER